MTTTAIPVSCKACGKPIVQVPGGHRVKVYCNAACLMRDRRKATKPPTQDTTLLLARIAELESQVETLEERLQRIKEVEVMYLRDTKPRHFKTWLRKQSGSKSPFAERFLRSPDMPPMGSRALYEAHMRASGYKPEEIETFRDWWKAMLISEV